jgi:hypothetical protein
MGGPNVGGGLLDYGEWFARDFNGVGKTDLACHETNGSNNWDVALSTGSGWNLGIRAGGIPHTLPAFEVCVLGTFNNDDKVDLACFDAGYASAMMLSTATDWDRSSWSMYSDPLLRTFPIPGWQECFSSDFHGEGLTDLACAGGTSWPMAHCTFNSFTDLNNNQRINTIGPHLAIL